MPYFTCISLYNILYNISLTKTMCRRKKLEFPRFNLLMRIYQFEILFLRNLQKHIKIPRCYITLIHEEQNECLMRLDFS